jgi:hypothetical protein
MSIRNQNVCWKCKADKEATWTFCPICGSRIKDTRNPSPPNPLRDTYFLYDLYSFGWYNHHVAALVLYDATAAIDHWDNSNIPENQQLIVEKGAAQQILRSKIFAENIALLEAFGTLCLAIAKRKTQSFMWTFLNTDPQDVTQFYDNIISSKPKSLQRLLKLPSLRLVQEAIDAGTNLSIPGLPDLTEPITIEQVRYDYEAHCENFIRIAQTYREPLGGASNEHKYNNVTIYNKIKHIFSLVKGHNWLDRPIESAIAGIVLDDKVTIAPLPMSQAGVDDEISNIYRVTITGAEIMALWFLLHRLGVLF